MYFLNDIDNAEFARRKGSKDKKKRKRTALKAGLATASGGALGSSYAFQRGLNKAGKSVKGMDAKNPNLSKTFKDSINKANKELSLRKGAAIGAGVGLAGYGAYRGVQALQDRIDKKGSTSKNVKVAENYKNMVSKDPRAKVGLLDLLSSKGRQKSRKMYKKASRN